MERNNRSIQFLRIFLTKENLKIKKVGKLVKVCSQYNQIVQIIIECEDFLKKKN